uniref:Protein transport protein Sec61 subunit beta n=2 Tax=Talaromyces marneffei TaxID=37727 RepID=A0A093XEC4_TALMA
MLTGIPVVFYHVSVPRSVTRGLLPTSNSTTLDTVPIHLKNNSFAITMASPRASSPLASGTESGPDSKVAAGAAASGSAVNRPSSPTPPGGPRTALRRRAAADHKESLRNARPTSTRAAGAGGSSGTMLKLYTDESPGLRVDPVVVLVLSLGFIFSVVGLHVIAKITRNFSS